MRRNVIAQGIAALILALAAMPAIATPPPTFTTVHEFDVTDGDDPSTALMQGLDGFLYGSGSIGGANSQGDLFKIDDLGNNFADILDFDNASPPAGENVLGALIQGTDGNLYGTTADGGANGDGNVFKVAPDGTGYVDLYDFGGVANDPVNPLAGLVQGSDGNFYGTAELGGPNNEGAVFKISSVGGSITILHSFGLNDIAFPADALIEGEDGSLYGTANSGSSSAGGIFRINLDGSGYAVLHNFVGGATDGSSSLSSLTQGGDGFLYGATSRGGADGAGVVFKIAPDGTGYQVLYSLAGEPADVAAPAAGLALGNDGNLYGAGTNGAANGMGGLFEIARNGTTDILLHSFAGADGEDPLGGLIQATNGIFFGTTQSGTGAAADGTIFSLDTGLPPSPTGLYALGSDAQVQLFWNTDADQTVDVNAGYDLYRSTTSGGEGSTPYQTNLPSPNFVDNNVTNGTQYFYKVTGITPADAETAKSYEVTATPQMAIDPTGLSATPNPVTAVKTTTGTLAVHQATVGPTTAFLSSDNPNVTFNSPDVTVPATDASTTFTINTNNIGSQYTADITASENGTDSTTTITVDVPSILHTYQAGLQMIAANTDDTGITLANDFGQSNPTLAVWGGSGYLITPIAPANKIVPGQGYWFHPTSTANLYDVGIDESINATVNVALSQGWNMIGNPFGDEIAGGDLQVQNGANTVSLATANTDGLIGDTLYTLQPGDNLVYETQSVSSPNLGAYEGYWLYAFQPCTLVLQDAP